MQPTETPVESASAENAGAGARDRDGTGEPGYVAAVPEAMAGGSEVRPGQEPDYPVPTPEAGTGSSSDTSARTDSGNGATSPLTVQVEEAVQHNPFAGSRTEDGAPRVAGSDPGSPGYTDNSGPPGDPGPGATTSPTETSQVPGYDAAGAAAAAEARRRAEAEAAAEQDTQASDPPERAPLDDLRPIGPGDLASVYPGNGASGEQPAGTIPPGAEGDARADLERPGIGPVDLGDGSPAVGVGHGEAPTSEAPPGTNPAIDFPVDLGRDFPGRTQPGGVYEAEPADAGTPGLPPGLRDSPVDLTRPGIGVQFPPGDGSPPADMPSFDAPEEAPGHDLPTDLERPGPGPRFDPDENPVPPGHGDHPGGAAVEEDCGPEEERTGVTEHPGANGPGYSQPPSNGAGSGGAHAGAAAAAATGLGLDVFYAGTEDGPASLPASADVVESQPTGSVIEGESPLIPPSGETLDPGALNSPLSPVSEPAFVYQEDGRAPELTPGSTSEVPAASDISQELTALADQVRTMAASLVGGSADRWDDRGGSRSIAELISDLVANVREAVFQRGDDGTEAQLAFQLAELDEESLTALARLSAEQPVQHEGSLDMDGG